MTLAKLTVLFGESDRSEGRLLSDELMRECTAHSIRASVLMRAAEGFGIKHQLHTERLLTLSEDLPLAVTAIDAPGAIHALAERITPLVPGGLVTVEGASPAGAPTGSEVIKLTMVASRRHPAREIVGRLKRAGMDAAVVLLGVDGTIGGERRRARFFSGNRDVPTLIVAIGSPESAAPFADAHVAAVERVVVCKRDGELLADPRIEAPPGWWQRLSIHSHDDLQLVRHLRRERAAGATSLHGVWGFSGSALPHGDRFFALGRTVPVLTVVVDRPDAVARWWHKLDELTPSGVVTSELVPQVHAIGAAQTSPR